MTQLGDLTLATHARPPAKLLKGLAVIAAHLHPLFDAQGWLAVGKSKESCVLSSLAVRDFLQAIGFADARAMPVATVIRAFDAGHDALLHSVGIGTPHDKRELRSDRWRGHLVVACSGWLIDTTLYPAIRPQWDGLLTGMVALPLKQPTEDRFQGLRAIAGFCYAGDKTVVDTAWFSNPKNRDWIDGPDAQPWRHEIVVERMVAHFGTWNEAPKHARETVQ